MKNLIIKLSFVAVLLIATKLNYGQDDYLPSILPPSPSVSELGKYGEYPVSHNTGVPNISIPLYEITGRSLKLPISISYHASGIKVDAIASPVGLGWSLNAGGVITRQIRGLNDEDPNGFQYNSDIRISNELNMYNEDDYNYVQNIHIGGKDTEPDLFFYNFAGHSGKMIINNEKSFVTNNNNAWQIIPEWEANRFRIIVEDGTEYIFGESLSGVDAFEESHSYLLAAPQIGGVTAWSLTEIVSADRSDTIFFEYENLNYSELRIFEHTQTIKREGSSVNIIPFSKSHRYISRNNVQQLTSIKSANGIIEFIYVNDRQDHNEQRLASIEVKNKELEIVRKINLNNNNYFNRTGGGNRTCKDEVWEAAFTKSLKLDGVDICAANTLEECKTYGFYYNTSTPLPPRNTTAQDLWGYYNGQSSNTNLVPPRDFDFGTIYTVGSANRESSEEHMKAGILNKITFPTGGHTEYSFEPHYYLKNESRYSVANPKYSVTAIGEGGIEAPVPESIDTFRLKKDAVVTFRWHFSAGVNVGLPQPSVELFRYDRQDPLHNVVKVTHTSPSEVLTGEQTEYLEAGVLYGIGAYTVGGQSNGSMLGTHYASATVEWEEKELISSPDSFEPVMVGGLRVKQISNYDSDNELLKSKNFKYGDGEYGLNNKEVGNLINYDGVFTIYHQELVDDGAPPGPADHYFFRYNDIYTVQANSTVEIGTNNGSPVEYTMVTVYEGDVNNPNGKTMYYYEPTTADYVSINQYAMHLAYPSWKQNKMIKQESYRYTNGQYILQKHVENNYINICEGTVNTLKVQKVIEDNTVGASVPTILPGTYRCYTYDQTYGQRVPTNTTTINYDLTGNEISRSTTNYEYVSENGFLRSKSSTNSKRESSVSTHYYPFDTLLIPDLSNAEKDILNTMVSKNMLYTPVEVTHHVNGNLISRKRTKFQHYNNRFIVPESVWVQIGDNSIEEKIKFLTYNYFARLETYQLKDQVPVAFIWNKNSTYPLAKVENATSVSGWPETRIVTTEHKFGAAGVLGTSGTALTLSVPQSTVQLFGSLTTTLQSSVTITMETTPASTGGSITLYPNRLSHSDYFVASAGQYTVKWNNLGQSDQITGSVFYTHEITETINTGRESQVYYNGFEEDNNKVSPSTFSKSGKYAYQGVYSVDVSNIEEGDYTIDYWTSTDGVNWSNTTESVSVTSALTSINVGQAGAYVDEIRLHPQHSTMQTLSYDNNGKVISTTDLNGNTSYYNYDGFDRLKLILDKDMNILNLFNYNLKK